MDPVLPSYVVSDFDNIYGEIRLQTLTKPDQTAMTFISFRPSVVHTYVRLERVP